MSGTSQTSTNSPTAAPAAQPVPSQPVPAASAPTLLGAEAVAPGGGPQEMPAAFEGGAEAWGKLDDAGKTAALGAATEKATAESKARTDAFAAAFEKEGKLAAWNALTAEEKAATFKAMKPEDAKALGIEDPAIPVYDIAKFTAPEGMTLDETELAPALELFKENRLSQEQAQKFIDLATQRELAAAQKNVQAFVDLQTKWQGEVMADPELGGSKWEASKASVDRLMDRLNIPGLKEALNLTGAGNNPAVVKAFVRLGNMVSEDKVLSGQPAASPAVRTPAEVIYGDPQAAS